MLKRKTGKIVKHSESTGELLMNLGEFRVQTADLPDSTDIYICQVADGNLDESLVVGMSTENNEILLYDA